MQGRKLNYELRIKNYDFTLMKNHHHCEVRNNLFSVTESDIIEKIELISNPVFEITYTGFANINAFGQWCNEVNG